MGMASQILEEFLESIEGFPREIQLLLNGLIEKDSAFEDVRRGLSKRRTALMKAKSKGLDEATQESLTKRVEKDYCGGLEMIEEKIQLGDQAFQLIDKHIRKLDAELMKLNADGEYKKTDYGYYEPPRRILESPRTFGNSVNSIANSTGTSPKKQSQKALLSTGTSISTGNSLGLSNSTIVDVPIDPNEPVYCICRQVSFGDMIACDNNSCEKEWFHYPCVGLVSPPKGKWFCTECIAAQKMKHK